MMMTTIISVFTELFTSQKTICLPTFCQFGLLLAFSLSLVPLSNLFFLCSQWWLEQTGLVRLVSWAMVSGVVVRTDWFSEVASSGTETPSSVGISSVNERGRGQFQSVHS